MEFKLFCLLSILFGYNSYSQEILVIYDIETQTFKVSNKNYKVKNGKNYNVKLININSAHISTVSTITMSEYVSDIPEILKPIYTGLADNNISGIISIDEANHNKSFKIALEHFKYLEEIKSITRKFYDSTNYNLNITEKKIREEAIKVEKTLNQLENTGKLDDIVLKIEEYSSFIKAITEIYTKQIEGLTFSDPNYNLVVYEYSILKLIHSKIESNDYLNQIVFVKKSLEAEKSLLVKTFQAGKDVVDLDLKIYDNYLKDTIYSKTLSFKTYNNFSFDFSTGIFYSNLVENKYFISPRTENINNVVIENIDNVDISIGALGHFTYKFSPNFGAGLALGASVSPFDGNIRYLLGPTFLVGHQKQVSLSLGLALAHLDQLSDSVQNDEFGFFIPSDVSEIKTIKKVDTGFFVSLTYNLTKKKK
jgi:hypothetical protein